ncbi:MAG: hypothetical protein ACE37F_35950 [Nannocystaceae bacterium]|nr:hypothetical protein [bacterium]
MKKWGRRMKELVKDLKVEASMASERRFAFGINIAGLAGLDSEQWPEVDETNELHALVTVKGFTGRLIEIEFKHSAFIKLDLRNGTITVQVKAVEVWARGLHAWMRWLDLIGRLFTGQGCTPETSYAAGWRTWNLELCSDFVGLAMHRSDADFFAGRGKRRTFGQLATDEQVVAASKFGGAVETIMIGKRGDWATMCVYHKTRQLRAAKGSTAAESMYAPAWHRSGNYHRAWDVTRVEIRLGHRSLLFHTDRDEELDLRDPVALLDRTTLGRVWASETQRRRLTSGTNTRSTRRPTDPRWIAVQKAAAEVVPTGNEADLLRVSREVKARVREDVVARDLQTLVRVVLRLDLLGRLDRSLLAVALDDARQSMGAKRFDEILARVTAECQFLNRPLMDSGDRRGVGLVSGDHGRGSTRREPRVALPPCGIPYPEVGKHPAPTAGARHVADGLPS